LDNDPTTLSSNYVHDTIAFLWDADTNISNVGRHAFNRVAVRQQPTYHSFYRTQLRTFFTFTNN